MKFKPNDKVIILAKSKRETGQIGYYGTESDNAIGKVGYIDGDYPHPAVFSKPDEEGIYYGLFIEGEIQLYEDKAEQLFNKLKKEIENEV